MHGEQYGMRMRNVASAVLMALGMAGCGGGGGGNVRSASPPPPSTGSGGGTSAGTILVAAGTKFAVASNQSVSKPVVLESNSTLDNAGSVGAASGTAVEGKGSSATILNHDGATIHGGDHAVMLDASGTIKNSNDAVINGGKVGIGIAGFGTVNNTAGATISGGSIAIELEQGGSVFNGSGSIIKTTGTVSGDCANGGSCAIFASGGALKLTNAGTIIGNVQTVPTADNDITLLAGSSIRGDLELGAGQFSSLTLDGDEGTVQSYAQAVTGRTIFGGYLYKSGLGTWIIDNDDLHAASVEVSGGTLQIGNGGTKGSIGQTDIFLDHGRLVFDRSDDVVFDGSIGGSGYGDEGTLVQAGTGVLTLTSTNLRPTSFLVESGTLQFGNTGSDPAVIDSYTIDVNAAVDGVLAFDSNWALSYDGVISGTGSLVQNGSGTVVLRGNDTYTGGTTINSGTLQIGDGYASGWITGNVLDNAALAFSRMDEVTFAGIVSGSGSLEQIGSGSLVLTGDNTYSGGTTISGDLLGIGTVQLGNGGTRGWIQGDVVDNGVLAFDRSDDMAFDGSISGAGSVVQRGSGRVVLTATNTYTGGTTIEHGTLQVGDGARRGSIVGDVLDDATLVFDRSDDVTFSGRISGSGSLEQHGTGTLTLTGENSYSGGTTISYSAAGPGILQVGNGGTGGSIAGDVLDNGLLIFNRSDITGFDGRISGTGAVVKNGSGSLILEGENTYTGGTTINAGSLRVGDGAHSGSLTGDVLDNAALVFYRSDALTFDGRISGSGSLKQDGSGTLVLTADSTYTGGTTISHSSGGGGTLQLGDGGTSGWIAGDVVNNGVFAFDRSDDVVFDGLISGTGRLVKRGEGTLVLSRMNTFSGGSSVEQGTLELRPGTSLGTGTISVGSATGTYTGQVFKVDSGTDFDGYIAMFGGATLDNAGSIHRSVSNATVESSGAGGVTVTNRDGALIEGPYEGIVLADGGTVSNGQGSTISGSSRGIVSNDGSLVVSNAGGTISGLGSPQDAYATGDAIQGVSATITNDLGGRIEGRVAGILVNSGGTILNRGGSLISASASQGYGVLLYGGGVVTNDGATIQATYRAVSASGGAVAFSNLNGGSIVGAVQLDANAANSVTLMAGSSLQGNLSIGSNPQSTLTLNGDNAQPQSYSDAVTGSTTFAGSLVKEGAGAWNIDTSTLSGVTDTEVNDGTLSSTVALSGKVNVAAQGTLDAVPAVAGNLANAGKVSVHGGDTTAGGNYVQSSTGSLAVSLGSKLDVAGTATLNGGTLEVTGADAGYVSDTHTDVLTAAGGLAGSFDRLVKDSGVVFTSSTIHYDANSVWLDTTGLDVTTAAAGDGVSYTPVSMASAIRVQGAFRQLDASVAQSSLSDVPDDFLRSAGQFQQSPTLLAAQASLQSLSGQLHAQSAAMAFETIDASSRALSDRLDQVLGQQPGAGMWTHELGMGGDMARPGYDGVGFQLNGWLVGSDHPVGQSGVAGYAFGQSQGQQRLEQGFDHQSSRSTQAMLYAGALDGVWYTQGRVGFGHFEHDVRRQILLGSSEQGVAARYSGNFDVAYGESGLSFGRRGSYIKPFISLEYARIARAGFAEQGAGGFGLRSNAQTLDRWQAGSGVRVGYRWDLGNGRTIDFSTHAQWQRTLATHGAGFDASFVGLQEWQPLVGIGLSRYSRLFGLGLDAALSEHSALTFRYDDETGQRVNGQMVSARLDLAF